MWINISALFSMRSHGEFEDLGCDFSRLARPGYWQNRGGFAFNPHVLAANADTPPRPSPAKRENQPECEKCGLSVDERIHARKMRPPPGAVKGAVDADDTPQVRPPLDRPKISIPGPYGFHFFSVGQKESRRESRTEQVHGVHGETLGEDLSAKGIAAGIPSREDRALAQV